MAFFNDGERKKRPGVYMRIVNIGEIASTFMQALPPESGGSDEHLKMGLYVSPEGVLYSEGQALSLGTGSDEDGYTVVIDARIDAAVYDGMLVVNNTGA